MRPGPPEFQPLSPPPLKYSCSCFHFICLFKDWSHLTTSVSQPPLFLSLSQFLISFYNSRRVSLCHLSTCPITQGKESVYNKYKLHLHQGWADFNGMNTPSPGKRADESTLLLRAQMTSITTCNCVYIVHNEGYRAEGRKSQWQVNKMM